MGVAIPQVITSDRASGAQVIDGSLKFEDNFLTRTPSSQGNLKSWTWSAWVKPDRVSGNLQQLFEAKSGGTDYDAIYFTSGQKLSYDLYRSSQQALKITNRVFRDTGWYHIVVVYDAANSTADDRVRIYVNGERETSFSSSTNPDTTDNSWVNDNSIVHQIGDGQASNQEYDGRLSQVYLIDGQALDASYFGFTDPLTNTWKPKKFSGSFTTTDILNDGTTWSSSASVDTGSSDMTNAFDGDISTATSVGLPSGGATVTFTPSSAITVSTGLRVYMAIDRGQSISVNGSQTNASVSAGWNDTGFTGSLTSLVIGPANSGSSNNIAAIEIDGITLVDGQNDGGENSFYLPMDGNSSIGKDQSGQGNDWTPVNFGGSLELDNPNVSAAKPILNTTQGGTQAGVGVFGSKQNVGYAVTVYNDGGGNKYYIDGVKQDTVTGLIRGATYTFDTSDSTVSSHPFRFSATSNGSHGGGSEYTNGVAAITGTATTITVPHDAPNTLYYYCTSHSGMGADITGITTNEKLADQYASHCVLALPLVGSKSDVSASIACTMTNKAVTSNANAAASNDQSNFYTGSFEFDGTGDNLSITASTDFAFEGGDYTIEWWQWWNAAPADYASIFDVAYTDAASMVIQSNGTNAQWIVYVEGGPILTEATATQFKKWTHYALVRNGTSVKLYRDGITSGSATNSGTSHGNGTHTAYVAGDEQGYEFNGYVQDFRIYKGVAKYTSEFVVPSRSPDVLPDTPSGVSGSSELTKITDGSVSFDGTSDSLTFTSTSDLSLDGDFTIEFWAYPRTIVNDTSDPSPITMPTDGSAISQIYIHSTNFNYNLHKSSVIVSTRSNTAVTNRWQHVAFTRSGTTVYAFFDGVLQDTATSSATFGGTSGTFRLGSFSEDNGNYDGFMSNVRIVKGTALYTSRFTPPTRALTNVTNTKLLCCQSNTSAIEGAVKPGAITAVGDAAATNFNPFNTDINTVRGQESGYATLNPLDVDGSTGTFVMADGNLEMNTFATNYSVAASTITFDPSDPNGFYFESTGTNSAQYAGVGVAEAGTISGITGSPGRDGNLKQMLIRSDGYWYYNSGSAVTSGKTTWTSSDVIGCAFKNNKIWVSKNGMYIDSGNPVTEANPNLTWDPANHVNDKVNFIVSAYTSNPTVTVNFGQKPFKFPPPDGFQPLNNANVRPETVIARPDQYVGVTTFQAPGSEPVRFDVFNFQPDLLIGKSRTHTYNFEWVDSVTGGAWLKLSNSDGTATEYSSNPPIQSFNYNGFTASTNFSVLYNSGDNPQSVVWGFKAGGSKGTFNKDGVAYASAAAAGLTGGALTVSGCSIGTKQGFSIIKYNSGSTNTNNTLVSHGLGKTPRFIIHKTLSTGDWYVYHADVITDLSYYLRLNSTDERKTAGANIWGSTAPNNNTFGVRVGNADANPKEGVIKTNEDAIAYLWCDIPGLQKFGTYEGNENTGGDGPFVELGFRPAIIWIKNSEQGTSAADWVIYDSERNKFNPSGKQLYPNRNVAEADDSNHQFDILSNGFKVRSTSTSDLTNATDKYIYCAWAAAPSVDLYGGGANAR